MIRIRRGEDRGRTKVGWLDGRHTFSFGEYHDPANVRFRTLRVINDDRVAPGGGFAPHPHRDMEILTYVIEGALEHEDSTGGGGGGGVIRPGDVQRMSAGTGVTHSEYNHSKTEPVRLLQVWIFPAEKGEQPSYEQRHFPESERRGALRLIASPDGAERSLTIGQDARVYAGLLSAGDAARHDLAPGRGAWVQVARGSVSINGEALREGDGAAVENETSLELAASEEAEVLVFDLA